MPDPRPPSEAPRPPIVVRRPAIDFLHADRPGRDAGNAVDKALVSRAEGPGMPEGGLSHYWWGDDPFRTHFLNALSSTFPFGEAFFVRSVRHYADRIDDPVLAAEVRAFAAQEGHHSRLHDEHVELLVAQGYGALETRNRIFDRVVRWHNKHTPAFALAVTAALEHLTAILARQLLEDRGGWLDDMHPEMQKLWRWHALEESEHKAVAFDVMNAAGISRGMRVFAMAVSTLDLVLEVSQRMGYMFWKDGRLFEGRAWADGLRFLFGRGGFLRGVGGDYLAWYRRSFHPEQIDDRPMIERVAPEITSAIAG